MDQAAPSAPAPSEEAPLPFAAGTVEAWAFSYVTTKSLAHKLAPPEVPEVWSEHPMALRIERPGRGPELSVRDHGEKSSGKSALKSAEKRARLIHTFLHHELQAAELMAWALLAFPDTPKPFRRGLIGILFDEVNHMHLYCKYLRARGYEPGCFAVRDWFWERIPTVASPAGFCATMGMGFEAANLDHARRFAIRFRAAGDEEAAVIEEVVHAEEIPHVRFATHWFERFTSEEPSSDRFDLWTRHLPAPLSPLVMRGEPLDRGGRLRAGADAAFVDRLEAWKPA